MQVPRAAAEPDERDAARLLIDLSRDHDGRLHVITIGPMTNLAHALAQDPTLPDRIAHVTSMGGAALSPGNISPVAEANVFNDPEAAAAVLGATWDTTLVPLDVTMRHALHEDDRLRLIASADPLARTVGRILDRYFDYYLPQFGDRLCPLHDPLAAMVAAGAPGIGASLRVPVVIDTTGGPGRGQTIVDMRGQLLGPRDHDGVRTRVLQDADELLSRHLLETLLGAA